MAADLDLPAQSLSFSLGANAPDGAFIYPQSGVFYWRPTELQGPSTNLITIIVSDNGTPSLSASREVSVVVVDSLPDFVLGVGSTNLFVSQSSFVPIQVVSGLELTNVSFTLEVPVARLTGLELESAMAGVQPGLGSGSAGIYTVTLTTVPGQSLIGDHVAARLYFAADSNEHSAIVPLNVRQLAGTLGSGLTLSKGAANNGSVIVIGREPVLTMTGVPQPALSLYGKPGSHYLIQALPSLRTNLPWADVLDFNLTNSWQTLGWSNAGDAGRFFRAVEHW